LAADPVEDEAVEDPFEDAPALTRPACAYPQVARYSGTGDANDAGNFACVMPKGR
jgi:hypothetical protein